MEENIYIVFSHVTSRDSTLEKSFMDKEKAESYADELASDKRYDLYCTVEHCILEK